MAAVAGQGALLSFPITWLSGLLMAHHFDKPGLRTLPFLANLLPVAALTLYTWFFEQADAGGPDWAFFYLMTLCALLLVGLMAALQKEPTEEQGMAPVSSH